MDEYNRIELGDINRVMVSLAAEPSVRSILL